MKPTALFCLAALLASIATSAVAETNVYSANVVGYYDVRASANQKIMLGNQLHTTTNDTLAAVIPNPPPLSQFFKYDRGFSAYIFDDVELKWSPDGNVSLAPGEGGFFISPVNTTLTFLGEVMQGRLTNMLPRNTKVIRCSIVPQTGRVTTELGLPADPLDQMWVYGFGGFGYSAFQFDDLDLIWYPKEATNFVGGSFFYLKNAGGTQTNWIRNFTVQ